MVALACGWCRRACDLRGGATVLFHEPTGDAGTACSRACSEAIRTQHPTIIPLLDRASHFECAHRSLSAAIPPLLKASGQSAMSLGADVLNVALLLGGVRLRVDNSLPTARVLAEADHAVRPLQQALLHLLALQALGVKLGATVSEIAGCNVDRLSIDVDVAGDQCTAMLHRVEAALRVVNAARQSTAR